MTPYKEGWTVRPVLWLFRAFLGKLLYRVMGKYRLKGEEKVPRQGGLLVLSNHLSSADPPFLQLACPRRLYYMANSELWDWPDKGSDGHPPNAGHRFARWLANYYGAFPVKVKSPDRAALRRAVELVKSGEAVCIFPEGGTSPGGIQRLFSGPALIARQARCPIICLGLRGTGQIIAHNDVAVRRAKDPVHAEWGEPWTPGEDEGAAEIMARIRRELSLLSGLPMEDGVGDSE